MNESVTYSVLWPYVVTGALLLTLAGARGWRRFDRHVDLVFCIGLICLAAVVAGSVDLGTDAGTYRDYYERLSSSSERFVWWEPGFELISILFVSFSAPYGFFIFACVLLSHLIKLHVFNGIVANRVLAFSVLFCLNLGEVAFVRQYLSASLVLLSFYLFTRKRSAAAIFMILAATLIHKTAIIVGVVVIVVHFGRSCVRPIIILVTTVAVIATVLPSEIRGMIESRIYTQLAAYTVEGFVQGMDAEEVSRIRNLVKFFLYVSIASWMALIPVRSATDQTQNKSAYIVFALSILSVLLILLVSTVFARLSVYIFPFLALSVRAERFAPRRSQFAGQSVVVALLIANLVISTYPLAAYL